MQKGIDVLKVLASFMVVGLHFFLNTNYYALQLDSGTMVLEASVKWFMLAATALFILITGYLQCQKTCTKRYYIKLIPIIISYLGIAVLALITRMVWGHEQFTIMGFLLQITSFTAVGYSWYVNMFIGLYLFAPFLNRILIGLSKKHFQLLIFTLLVVIALPRTLHPFLSIHYNYGFKVVPDFWLSMYPLIFYFIGAYIRTFQPKVASSKLLLTIFSMMAIQTLLSYYESVKIHTLYAFNDIDSIFMIVESTSIFLLFYAYEGKHKIMDFLSHTVAHNTLEILLFTGISDPIVYSYLNQYPQTALFYFYPLIVISIYIGICIISYMYKQGLNFILKKVSLI